MVKQWEFRSSASKNTLKTLFVRFSYGHFTDDPGDNIIQEVPANRAGPNKPNYLTQNDIQDANPGWNSLCFATSIINSYIRYGFDISLDDAVSLVEEATLFINDPIIIDPNLFNMPNGMNGFSQLIAEWLGIDHYLAFSQIVSPGNLNNTNYATAYPLFTNDDGDTHFMMFSSNTNQYIDPYENGIGTVWDNYQLQNFWTTQWRPLP